MTEEKLEVAIVMKDDISDLIMAIHALDTTKDHHGNTIPCCFLRPVVKDLMLSELTAALEALKIKFDQL